MSKTLTIIEKKVLPVVEEVVSFTIQNPEHMVRATEILSFFNEHLKASEKDRREQTDPIEAGLEKIREKYRPLETKLKEGIKVVRLEMSRYQTEADRKAEEEANAIAARQGEGRGKFTADTAARKIDEIQKPAAIVTTGLGKVSFREDKILKITDVDKIPREYFELNEYGLLKALKSGVKVEGAELEIVKTPTNRR